MHIYARICITRFSTCILLYKYAITIEKTNKVSDIKLYNIYQLLTRSIVNSRIPMRRVTIYTLSITIFYFLCQLPFWLSQIYGTLIWFYESGNSNQRPNQHNRLMVQIQYICHFFPFVNSVSIPSTNTNLS